MATESTNNNHKSLKLVLLKVWKSIKWGISMLWPDKSATSRMCFGMALACVIIFVFNAVFTMLVSSGLLINEMASRAGKDLTMAKMICDREEQKSDSVTTDSLFRMIMASGIDSTFIVCLTDTTDKIVACNKANLVNDSIHYSNKDGDEISINAKNVEMKLVEFNDRRCICLNDTVVGGELRVKLVEPLLDAFESVVDDIKYIGIPSLVFCAILVICYLVVLFNLRRTTSRTKQIEGELDVAANIQKQMVPLDFSVFPEKHGYNLHGMLHPAKTMGGDLLDYVLHEDKLFFCIGDVSGKGMPAALFMSQVHVLFHHVLAFTKEPSDICSAMNRSLAEGNDTNMFCTFFLGIIDFETNIMSYCNAGHNKPVIIDSTGKAEFVEVIPNIALGLIDEFPFQTQQMELTPGTAIVTYTDGVTEAESLNKQVLGDDALLQVLSGKQQSTPSEIISLIMNRINEHAMLAEQSDDITMLVLKRKAAV